MAEQVSNLQGSLSVDVSQLDKAAATIERFGKAGIDAFRKLTKSQEIIVTSLGKLEKSIDSLTATLATFPKSISGIAEASKKASIAVSGLSSVAGKQGLNVKKLGDEHKRLSDLVSKSGLSQKKQEELVKSLDSKYNSLSKSIEQTGASSDSTKKKEESWLTTISRVTAALEKQSNASLKPLKTRDNSKQLLADVKALGLYSLEEAVAVKNTEKLTKAEKSLLDIQKTLRVEVAKGIEAIGGFKGPPEAATEGFKRLQAAAKRVGEALRAGSTKDAKDALTGLTEAVSTNEKAFKNEIIALQQREKIQSSLTASAKTLIDKTKEQTAVMLDNEQGQKALNSVQKQFQETTKKSVDAILNFKGADSTATEAVEKLKLAQVKLAQALGSGNLEKASQEMRVYETTTRAIIASLASEEKSVENVAKALERQAAANKKVVQSAKNSGKPPKLPSGGDGDDGGDGEKKEIDVSKKLLDIKQQLVNQTKRLTDTINNFRGAEDFAVGATNKLSAALKRAEEALETGDIDKAVDGLKLFRNATISITDELRQEVVMIGANEKAHQRLTAAEEEGRKTAILHMNALKEMRKEQNALLGIEQQLAQKLQRVNDLVREFKGPPDVANQAFQNIAASYNRLMEALRSKDVDAARIAIKNLSSEVSAGAGVLNKYEKETKEVAEAENQNRKSAVQVVQAEEEMRKEKQALILVQKKLDTALQATNNIIANSKAPTEAAARLTRVLFTEYQNMLGALATGKSKLADDAFKVFNENIKQAIATLKSAEDEVKRVSHGKVATRKKEEQVAQDFIGADKAMKSQAKATQDLTNIQKEAAHQFKTLNDAINDYKGPASVAIAETQKLFQAFQKFTQAIHSGDVEAARGAIKSFVLDVKGGFHELQKAAKAVKDLETANKQGLITQKALAAEMSGGISRFDAYEDQQRKIAINSVKLSKNTAEFITVIKKLGADSSITADLLNKLAFANKEALKAMNSGDLKTSTAGLERFRAEMGGAIAKVRDQVKAEQESKKTKQALNNITQQALEHVKRYNDGLSGLKATQEAQTQANEKLNAAFRHLNSAIQAGNLIAAKDAMKAFAQSAKDASSIIKNSNQTIIDSAKAEDAARASALLAIAAEEKMKREKQDLINIEKQLALAFDKVNASITGSKASFNSVTAALTQLIAAEQNVKAALNTKNIDAAKDAFKTFSLETQKVTAALQREEQIILANDAATKKLAADQRNLVLIQQQMELATKKYNAALIGTQATQATAQAVAQKVTAAWNSLNAALASGNVINAKNAFHEYTLALANAIQVISAETKAAQDLATKQKQLSDIQNKLTLETQKYNSAIADSAAPAQSAARAMALLLEARRKVTEALRAGDVDKAKQAFDVFNNSIKQSVQGLNDEAKAIERSNKAAKEAAKLRSDLAKIQSQADSQLKNSAQTIASLEPPANAAALAAQHLQQEYQKVINVLRAGDLNAAKAAQQTFTSEINRTIESVKREIEVLKARGAAAVQAAKTPQSTSQQSLRATDQQLEQLGKLIQMQASEKRQITALDNEVAKAIKLTQDSALSQEHQISVINTLMQKFTSYRAVLGNTSASVKDIVSSEISLKNALKAVADTDPAKSLLRLQSATQSNIQLDDRRLAQLTQLIQLEGGRKNKLSELEQALYKAVEVTKQSNLADDQKAAVISGLLKRFSDYKALLSNTGTSEKALAEASKKLALALGEINVAAEATGKTRLQKFFQDLAKSSQLTFGPLSGVSSRITTMSALLSANSLAVATSIAGLVLFGHTLHSIVTQGIAFEAQMARIHGIIAASGKQAVITSGQVAKMAQDIAESTNATAEDTRAAAASLLLFRGIDTTNLKEALLLAQGMASVSGGITDNAVMLGRALQDPINNLSSLAEKGMQFNKEQQKQIKLAMLSFDHHKAINIILERGNALQHGAVEEAKTLSGEIGRLGEKIKRFVNQITNSTGALKGLRSGIKSINNSLDEANNNARLMFKIATSIEAILSVVGGAVKLVGKYLAEIGSIGAVAFSAAMVSGLVQALLFITKLLGRIFGITQTITAAFGGLNAAAGALVARSVILAAIFTRIGAMFAAASWLVPWIRLVAILGITYVTLQKINSLDAFSAQVETVNEFSDKVKEAKDLLESLPEETTVNLKFVVDQASITKAAMDGIKEQIETIKSQMKSENFILELVDKQTFDTNRAQNDKLRASIKQLQVGYDDLGEKLGALNGAMEVETDGAKDLAKAQADHRASLDAVSTAFDEARSAALPYTDQVAQLKFQIQGLQSAMGAMKAEPALLQDFAKLRNMAPEKVLGQMTAMIGELQRKMGEAASVKPVVDFVRDLNDELSKANRNLQQLVSGSGRNELVNLPDFNAAFKKMDQFRTAEERVVYLRKLGVRTQKEGIKLLSDAELLQKNITTLTGLSGEYLNMSVIPGLRHTKSALGDITTQYEKQLEFLKSMQEALENASPELLVHMRARGITKEDLQKQIDKLNKLIATAQVDAISVPVRVEPMDQFGDFLDTINRKVELNPKFSFPTEIVSIPLKKAFDSIPYGQYIQDSLSKAAGSISSAFKSGLELINWGDWQGALKTKLSFNLNAAMEAAFATRFRFAPPVDVDPQIYMNINAEDQANKFKAAFDEASKIVIDSGLTTDFNNRRLAIDQAYNDAATQLTIDYFEENKALWAQGMQDLNNMRQAAQEQNIQMYVDSFKRELDITGQIFGNLTQIAEAGLGKQHAMYKRFAQVTAIIQSASAIMGVLADPTIPTPMKPALAASMAVLTGAQIAQIEASSYAKGGPVVGPGTPTSDSIPARLSKGEFVINAAAVKAFGANNLQMINQKKMVPEAVQTFNKGGFVNSTVNNINSTVNKFGPKITNNELPSVTKMVDYSTMRPMQQQESSPQNIRIVNAYDTAVVGDYLGSADGEKIIMNVLSKNGTKVRNIASGNY